MRELGQNKLRGHIAGLIGLFVLLPASDLFADVLDDLGDNDWVEIATPGGIQTGMLAFSGMAIDSVNQKVLVFGGGHWDYWGNEIWSLDIPTQQWTKMYEPDPEPNTLPSSSFKSAYPGAIFNPSSESLADARPLTRHTYDTVEFLSAHGEMFTAGTYTWGEGGYSFCWQCNDAWTYDVRTNRWTYKNRNGVPDTEGAAAAYDSDSDKLYIIAQGETHRYDPAADTWSQVSTSGRPNGAIEIVAEYDSKRGRIYMFGGEYPDNNELWSLDVGTRTWTRLNPSGSVPPRGGGYGLAYDSVNDVLLAVKNGLWAYNPNTNSWSKMNVSQSVPLSGRVHGNFKYDANKNVAILVASAPDYSVETWAYRYGGGALSTPTPKEPTELVTD